MTMSPPSHRLTALLVAAIHGIADALLPVIQAIHRQPARPWQQRARLAARFFAILRALLALTPRIRPAVLSATPSFSSRQEAVLPRGPRPASPRACHPAAPLTARQLAQCLATILNQLERLAAEAAAALPVAFHRHAARARAIAGCHALPPRGPDLANGNPSRTWERAG